MVAWLCSVLVVLVVYILLAYAAHINGKTRNAIIRFCLFASIVASVVSVHEMILCWPDIQDSAILALIISVLTFQREIIEMRKEEQKGE